MTELLSVPRIENSYRRAYIHKHDKKIFHYLL